MCLSVCPFVYLFVYLPICLYICLFVLLFVYLLANLSVCLSVCQLVDGLFVTLPTCLLENHLPSHSIYKSNQGILKGEVSLYH
jgi:hypothetical protein